MIIRTVIRSAFILIFLCLYSVYGSEKVPAPNNLTIGEGFKDPIGYYNAKPVFSWKLPVDKNVKSQSAYEIVMASDKSLLPEKPDLWSTKKVNSDQSVLIAYGGKPLDSRQQVYWQVRYWDQAGQISEWSDAASIEIGLLNNDNWSAQWIGYPFREAVDTTKFGTKIYPVQYLRKEIELSSDIVSARLHITSQGVFEAQINGDKVGDAVMTPGYTPYHERIETLTYDVTEMLNKGRNAIGLSVAPGWNTTRIGWSPSHYMKKNPPKVICQLEIRFSNGEAQTYITDSTWKSTNKGPIRSSEIYDGEIYNQGMELGEWSKVGFADSEWEYVLVEPINPMVMLQPKRHHPVKTKYELPTIRITKSTGGSTIFDMGQNIVGVPRVRVPMSKGDTLVIRFAEMLQENGDLYTESYRTAHSTDYYIASKDGWIDYTPKYTFHGFKYVELSGFSLDKRPDNDWVVGLAQYSDFDINGVFSSSDDKLNQLQSNIEWGLRGNFLDIPTDCPQRDERMGWTGDAQIFAPTAYYLADVHSFFTSWLQSVREEQHPNGSIPIVVPNVAKDRVSPGWGDAIAIIPWETYLRTGDTNVLKDNFPAMKKWVDFCLTHNKDGVIELKGFGDWLQPFSSLGNYGETPLNLIATAYCAYSAKLTMLAAEVLGYDTQQIELERIYESLRMSFEFHFFDKAGKLSPIETQTGYLMALGFDLLKDKSVREGAALNLLKMIEKADCHLGTGFLGTPLLAPVLDKIGRSDLMYTILFQETYPSWFYSINQGATTMWERWNSYSKEQGFGDANMNSFNHYAYGAVGQWMYERIAGISPLLPGYKRIRIAPYLGKQLSWAEGEHKSPYGRIYSRWDVKGDNLTMNVIIPPNTTAEIVIPCGDRRSTKINGMPIDQHKAITLKEQGADFVTVETVSGQYEITSKMSCNLRK